MKQTISKIVRSAGAGLALVTVQTSTALAQVPIFGSDPDGVPTGFSDIPSVINTIFRVVIGAAGAIFIVLFLVGGIQYLTAAGNEEATAKARRLLVDSIVGLIIVLAAWAIGSWVLGSLGLGSDTTNPYI